MNILYKKYYLEKKGWIDGTSYFKNIIESNLKREYEILDLGAGAASTHNYRKKVKKVVGVDIAEEVLSSPNLDEAYKCHVEDMPFENDRFDLAYADYLFEHMENPFRGAKEIYRVLKPGAVLIARTPNIWHYSIIISRLTPYRFHLLLRKWLQDKPVEDTFRTYYRCNSLAKIENVFKTAGFQIEEINMIEKEPSYLLKSRFLFMMGLIYERIVNSAGLFKNLRANVVAIFRKPRPLKSV